MTQPTSAPLASDLGLEDVPDGFADGVYSGFVTDCKIVHYKDAAKGKAIVFTYRCDVDPVFAGETIDEWKSANAGDPASKKKWLKMRLDSLGIPESRMSAFAASDVIGKAVFFTVKKNGEYRNVTKVELRSPENQAAAQSYNPAVQVTTPAVNVQQDVSALI